MPLVVLGGGPGLSSRVYRTYLAPIIQGHQVICWDYAATGNSKLREQASFEDDYRDLMTLIETAKLKKFSVFAHSYGGMLALQLANERPELMDRMMLLGAFPTVLPLMMEMLERKIPKWTPAEVDEMFALMEKMGEKTLTSEDLARFVELETKSQFVKLTPEENRHLAVLSEFNPLVYEKNETWFEKDFTPILPEIKVRTWVGIGKQDNIVPPMYSEPLLNIPGSVLAEFENSAHWASFEETRAFERELSSFMN